ncbi:MAG: hypothetical protein R3B13_14225 [Polyangiaceae bacterium]
MRTFAIVLCGLAALSCDEAARPSAQPSASAAPKAAASAPPSKPEPPPAPWYVGAWQGTYDAQQYLIEMTEKQGAVRDWKDDDGGTGEGEGSISLRIDESGSIRGEATGPLGNMIASGQVDDQAFRVRFNAKEPGESAFNGVVVLARKGETMSGRLQASSGDSKTIRDAPVELKKGEAPKPGAAPAASVPAENAPSASASPAPGAPSAPSP